MTQKTKTIILVVLILVLTVGVGVYVYNQKSAELFDLGRKSTEVSPIGEQGKNNAQENAPTVKASTISGTVSAISNNSIEIKNGEEKNSFSLTESTPIFSVEGKKIEKKTAGDIKKGETVSIMINQADKSILSIQIGKDAGTVF